MSRQVYYVCIFYCAFIVAPSPLWAQGNLPQALPSKASDTEKILYYIKLGDRLRYSRPDTAYHYLQKAIMQSKRSGQRAYLFRALVIQASLQHIHGKLDEAQHNLREASTWRKSAQALDLAFYYMMQGMVLYARSDYTRAMPPLLQSLALYEKEAYPSGIMQVANTLGSIHLEAQNLEKAQYYYERARQLALEAMDTRMLATILGNLGLIYRAQEQDSLAEGNFLQALSLQIELKDQTNASVNYLNLGQLYADQKLRDKALSAYQKALGISRTLHDTLGVCHALYNLGQLHLKTKAYPASEQVLREALHIATQEQYKGLIKEIYLSLSLSLAAQNEVNQALSAVALFTNWQDSLSISQQSRRIQELEARYQSEKKERQIAQLSQSNLQKQADLQKNRFWLGISLLILLLIITSFGFLLFYLQQRAKSVRQKAAIEAVAETQEQERGRISRDLHDSIGSMLATIKLRLHTYSNQEALDTPLPENVLKLLDETCDEVRRISHNLTPGVLLKFGLVSALQNLSDQIKQSDQLDCELFVFGLEDRLRPQLEIFVYRIVQELSQNVLKHAQARHLSISVVKHPQKINIMVEDDGKGMPPSQKPVEGIGLKNIHSRVRYLNGELHIDSQSGRGTLISINIPLRTKS